MRRTLLAFCLFVMLSNLSGQLTETGKRVSLTDGNSLYGWCQAYKDVVKMKDDRIYVKSADVSSAFDAGTCMGYVRGIVDSLPAGGGFSPNPNVKLTQYVDVVFQFLDEHPEVRYREAGVLVQVALTRTFPKK